MTPKLFQRPLTYTPTLRFELALDYHLLDSLFYPKAELVGRAKKGFPVGEVVEER